VRVNRKQWSLNLVAIAACAGAALPLVAGIAQASPQAVQAVAPSVALTLFAGPPPMAPGTTTLATNPDDITRLDDLVYVSFQNNAAADGTPAGSFSTLAAYQADTGALVTTYQLSGRCDGLTADPLHHRLLASVNEDNNSSLFVITPGATPVHYTYSPNPAQTGSDGTNGGTDAISITPDGTIYVAHSNPDLSLPAPNNTAAVYTMTLTGTTATLTPLFGVNDTATVINPPPGTPATAPLGLTDPDSNRFLARSGGTLIQDSQADSKLVLATNLHAPTPTLRQLLLTNAAPTSSGAPATPQLDDLTRVAGPGRLLVVDQAGNAIYSLNTSALAPGTVFVSQPAPKSGDLPNDPALGTLNLTTGVVTHLNTPLASPKGLLFLPINQTFTDALLATQDTLDQALSQLQTTLNQITLPPVGF